MTWSENLATTRSARSQEMLTTLRSKRLAAGELHEVRSCLSLIVVSATWSAGVPDSGVVPPWSVPSQKPTATTANTAAPMAMRFHQYTARTLRRTSLVHHTFTSNGGIGTP